MQRLYGGSAGTGEYGKEVDPDRLRVFVQ